MSKMQTTINKETNELIIVRSFNAPIQKVWDAYTKPELIVKWWGPRAFETEIKEMNVKPGGKWHYIMHGTGEALKGTEFEGMESAGISIYEKVEEPTLLVYEDAFADSKGNINKEMPIAKITVKFEETNGITTMISTTKYPKLEDLQKVIDMGVEQGMSETLDRLEELLAK